MTRVEMYSHLLIHTTPSLEVDIQHSFEKSAFYNECMEWLSQQNINSEPRIEIEVEADKWAVTLHFVDPDNVRRFTVLGYFMPWMDPRRRGL